MQTLCLLVACRWMMSTHTILLQSWTIAEVILSPRLSNVNESGFSMSWDFSELGKYYLYLCKKWDITPDEDAVSVAGLSVIIDKTNMW